MTAVGLRMAVLLGSVCVGLAATVSQFVDVIPKLDQCGVCDGMEMSCTECPTYTDCNGECGGNTLTDECGVCGGDSSTCTGCIEPKACNFNVYATISDAAQCSFGTTTAEYVVETAPLLPLWLCVTCSKALLILYCHVLLFVDVAGGLTAGEIVRPAMIVLECAVDKPRLTSVAPAVLTARAVRLTSVILEPSTVLVTASPSTTRSKRRKWTSVECAAAIPAPALGARTLPPATMIQARTSMASVSIPLARGSLARGRVSLGWRPIALGRAVDHWPLMSAVSAAATAILVSHAPTPELAITM